MLTNEKLTELITRVEREYDIFNNIVPPASPVDTEESDNETDGFVSPRSSSPEVVPIPPIVDPDPIGTSIRHTIKKLDKAKLGIATFEMNIEIGERQTIPFLADANKEKRINPLHSYQQRLYTYAGTACYMIDLLGDPAELPETAARKKELETAKKTLDDTIAKINKKIAENNTKITHLTNDKNKATQQPDIARIDKTIQKLASDNTNLQNSISNYQNGITTAQEELEQLASSSSKLLLKKKIQELTEQYAKEAQEKYKAQNEAIEKIIAEAETEVEAKTTAYEVQQGNHRAAERKLRQSKWYGWGIAKASAAWYAKAEAKAKAELEAAKLKLKKAKQQQGMLKLNFKAEIDKFTSELSRLLATAKDESGYALGVNRAALWLPRMEHWYVASLGALNHIMRFEMNNKNNGKQIFYQVTEYLPFCTLAEIKNEFNSEPPPKWFTLLTPIEQKHIEQLVKNNQLDHLIVLPSTVDRVPGIRNLRVEKTYQYNSTAQQPLILIDTSYASGSPVPNGIPDEKERSRVTALNAMQKLPQSTSGIGGTLAHVDLMTKQKVVPGKFNDSKLINLRAEVLQDLEENGNSVNYSNIPVNLFNMLATDRGKEEVRALIDEAKNKWKGNKLPTSVQYLIENLNYLLGLGQRHSSALAFIAAYAALLSDELGIETIFNCKSGKDRTGYILALKQVLKIFMTTPNLLKEGPAIPINYAQLIDNEKSRLFPTLKDRDNLRKVFCDVFCPIFIQKAKLAGNNSPGCDDLKLESISIPKFILDELYQRYPSAASGIANMNRPVPALGFWEKFTTGIKDLWRDARLKLSTGLNRPRRRAEAEATERTPLLASSQPQPASSTSNKNLMAHCSTIGKELANLEHEDSMSQVVRRFITVLSEIAKTDKQPEPLYDYVFQPLAIKFDSKDDTRLFIKDYLLQGLLSNSNNEPIDSILWQGKAWYPRLTMDNMANKSRNIESFHLKLDKTTLEIQIVDNQVKILPHLPKLIATWRGAEKVKELQIRHADLVSFMQQQVPYQADMLQRNVEELPRVKPIIGVRVMPENIKPQAPTLSLFNITVPIVQQPPQEEQIIIEKPIIIEENSPT